LLNRGYGEGGDFAIVQIPELKGRSCYRLSQKAVAKGDSVRTVGFPCLKSLGAWPQARNGVVGNVAGPGGVLAADSKDDFFLPNGTFTTDAEGVDCNSGTAALNSESEIVGVTDAIYMNQKKSMNTMFLSTIRMLELMPAELKQELLKLNSECKKTP
jgi:S1-C subfamily serine protease